MNFVKHYCNFAPLVVLVFKVIPVEIVMFSQLNKDKFNMSMLLLYNLNAIQYIHLLIVIIIITCFHPETSLLITVLFIESL